MKTKSSNEMAVAIMVLRSLRGWSQQELAEASGLSRVRISLFETGQARPAARTLKRLLAASGVPMSIFQVLLADLRLAAAGHEIRTRQAEAKEDDPLLSSLWAALRSAKAEMLSPVNARELGSPEPARHEAREAWARLRPFSLRDRRVLVDGAPEYQTWALCELVCWESQRAAAVDPSLAVELAELALRIAERMAGEESLRVHLKAYALTHRGNARRVTDNTVGAEADFRQARELRKAAGAANVGWWDQGIAFDLEASLRKDQRRFEEAVALHEQAVAAAGPERLGDILLNFGFTLEQMGEVERSVETLKKAAPYLDGRRSPRSLLILRFNLAVNLVHLDRISEAAALLPEVREMAARLRNELDLVRVRWLESRILAGQGRRAEAIEALKEVKDGFNARDLAYDTALVSLELAVFYLEESRTGEVKALARDMAPIFQAQGVHREALAALRLFCNAAEREAVTLETARRLVQYLEQARQDPEMKFA